MDRDGEFIKEWPPKWDPSIQKKLLSNIPSIENAAFITLPPFHDIISNGDRWNIRSAIGSDPAYFDVFSLHMIAGVPMDDADIDKRTHRIWISEELSGDVFASVDGAIGEVIECEGPAIDPDTQFIVAGVYASPREPQRKAWGIGDMVVPYTAFLKTGHGRETLRNIAAGQVVLKIDKQDAKGSEARIRSFLIREYGDDTSSLSIWEGSPRRLSAYEAAKTNRKYVYDPSQYPRFCASHHQLLRHLQHHGCRVGRATS
nr:ABC transporter permease [Sediminispirochaeta bajacaliforniensis]